MAEDPSQTRWSFLVPISLSLSLSLLSVFVLLRKFVRKTKENFGDILNLRFDIVLELEASLNSAYYNYWPFRLRLFFFEDIKIIELNWFLSLFKFSFCHFSASKQKKLISFVCLGTDFIFVMLTNVGVDID